MSARAEPPRAPDRKTLSLLLWGEVERLNIAVREVARRSGLPETEVRNYLVGCVLPPADAVAALERAFGRPPGWVADRLVSETASVCRSGS